MSYKALIDSNLTLAFDMLKDLAVDVVLNESSNNDFNFATGAQSDFQGYKGSRHSGRQEVG